MEQSSDTHISVRRKRSLLLFLLPAFALATPFGCAKPSLPFAPSRYVRIEALLQNHPLWSSVARLEGAKSGVLSTSDFSDSPTFSLSAFPKPLPPKSAAPLSEGVDRQSQIEKDARQAAAGIARSLTAQNKILIDQEIRREQKRIETELDSKLAEEIKLLKEINKIKVFAIFERLKEIAYQQAIYASKVNIYSQLTLLDNPLLVKSRAELKRLNDEADELAKRIKPLLTADLTSQTSQKRGAILKLLQIMSDERIARRKEELDSEKAAQVAAALDVQKQDAVPKPEVKTLPPIGKSTTPLTLPDSAFAPPAGSAVTEREATQRFEEAAGKGRDRLIAEIRRDTIQAVEQAAAKKGWKLTGEGQKGAIDSTVEMGGMLREQWRRGL